MPNTKGPDLAVLDFGVFITGSSSHSGRWHRLRVSLVPRVGPAQVEEPWEWDTGACPKEILDAVATRAGVFLTDEVIHQYGLQGPLFQ